MGIMAAAEWALRKMDYSAAFACVV